MYYNFEDFIYRKRKDGNRSKQYRHWCSKCLKDRGHAFKNKILKEPLCHACKMASKETRGKIGKKSSQRKHSQATKDKISSSLYKTHNSSPLQKTIKRNLRSRLNKALQGNYKSGSAVKDLGCSIEFLREYLEKQFKEDMSWDNYGEWHIDHIEPLCSFDLTDRVQLLKACHYTNLQPLWKKDNLEKRIDDYRKARKKQMC